MSRLKKNHHFNVDIKKKGSTFTKCNVCESLKDFISKLGKNSNDARKYEMRLKKPLA
jgi:hypothetical protein